MHAARNQALEHLGLRHPHIGHGTRAFEQLHQPVRLLDASAKESARPVVLPASRHEPDAGSQQRRGQRVAVETLVDATIEGEAHRPVAVDTATLCQAPGRKGRLAHDAAPCGPAGAAQGVWAAAPAEDPGGDWPMRHVAWNLQSTVQRNALNHLPQP